MDRSESLEMNRRAFLERTAWAVAAAAVGSGYAATKAAPVQCGASLVGFAAPKLDKIRVAVVGTGGRGGGAVHRLCRVPGVEVVALCELDEGKARRHQQAMKRNGFREPRLFIGPDGYRRLCDSGVCDLLHINTNWESHGMIALYSVQRGLHTMVEVPGVRRIDDAWAIVEAAEKNRCHCMMLSNCCYDEDAMTMINAAHAGILGELVHGEGCYLHFTRNSRSQGFHDANRIFSSLEALREHSGMCYCVHALGPISLAMNINRGDRLEHLVSMGNKGFVWQMYAQRKFGPKAKVSQIRFEANDFNTTCIYTAQGKTILLRQCNDVPMPYTRFNSIYGFNGVIETRPLRVGYERRLDAGAGRYLEGAELEPFRAKYGSPLWMKDREKAKKLGHGGQDYFMDYRWAHCIRNGLPLDMSIYDFAAWSAVFELSEKSVRGRSRTQDVPDFTRGAWKTAPRQTAIV